MLTDMRLEGNGFIIRPWRAGDEASLVRHANNRKIWRNLLASFPHPYRMEDAVWWIREAQTQRAPIENLAIEIDGEACGAIGLKRFDDAAYCYTREIGYWLGEQYWGRGVMTAAVGLFSTYAWDAFALARLEACVFAWNPGSARVLEKNGYVLEGIQRNLIYKDNAFVDGLLYAKTTR